MAKPQIQFRPEAKKPLIVGNKIFRSANCFQLSEEDMKKARIELSETEEKRKKCIAELRKRIAKDRIDCRTDDSYLLRYLRVRKFNCDKAYQNIKQCADFKKKYPEYFPLEQDLETLLNRRLLRYLPYNDEKGNIIFHSNAEKWDPSEQSFTELVQMISAVLDIIIENPKCQVNGIVGIYDFKAVNRHQISSVISNFGISKYIFLIQNLYSWRINKGLVINTGPMARLVFAMVRPLLSKKIRDRVVLLGSDPSELHQYVNPAILPKELGGTLEDDYCDVTQNIIDNVPFLQYDRSFPS